VEDAVADGGCERCYEVIGACNYGVKVKVSVWADMMGRGEGCGGDMNGVRGGWLGGLHCGWEEGGGAMKGSSVRDGRWGGNGGAGVMEDVEDCGMEVVAGRLSFVTCPA
jgi:hypothetical protein